METKERYGRFVLQVEDARTSAGSFYRAVQLGSSGYERHVQLFRSELLLPEPAQALTEGLKNGLLIHHAQVVRGFEAGRLDKMAFAAYEMFEGRSAGALLERSQAEGHPFAADHALLIASKVAAALEAAQVRKQIHGFLIPEFIHVSHDGEVSVRGFGLPPRVLLATNCVGAREARFLAPELDGTTPFDIRADIFSLGAQLFEMLTGAPLPRTEPTVQSIDQARMRLPGADGAPIPKALAALLAQALAEDPGRRFKDASVFKKAVDTLLFSGDYSPTTFNLAFFMHTLFRDESDDDAAQIKAERTADYRAYALPEVTGKTAVPAPAVFVSASGIAHPAAPPPAPVPPPIPVKRPDTTLRTDPIRADAFRAEAARTEAVARTESNRSGRLATPAPASPPPLEEQALFQSIAAEKKSSPMIPIVLGLIAVIAGASYLLTRSGSPSSGSGAATPAMNAAETAALARVRELESRLAALEAEKVAAEQKAADEAKLTVEAQALARGRAVDPAEVKKAQDEARKKAQADQEVRVQAERQKIEEERKQAEEARAAEAAKALEAAAAVATPQASANASSPPPAVGSSGSPGDGATAASIDTGLLDLQDPTVVAPELVSRARIEYPALARAQRIMGLVVVAALVDELGNVAEARVIRGVSANVGLNQAALENVKKRKYKPATQNGKPGRAWVTVQIDFQL